MREGVETRLDGSTLVVRIPMGFQRRGGRKRIVAPDGSAIVLGAKPQPDNTLLKALARAWRWQRMLDEGVYATVSEIGDAESISKSISKSYAVGEGLTPTARLQKPDPAAGALGTPYRGGDSRR